MWFSSSRERRLWTLAAAYVALLYASLPLTPRVISLLQDRGLLQTAVLALFGFVGAVLVAWVGSQRPSWKELVVVALFIGLWILLVASIPTTVERVHLLQYGLLALLFEAALREGRRHKLSGSVQRSWRSPAAAGLLALLLTSLCGWIDEEIQRILPNRYFDWRDVGFNTAAATLTLLAVATRRWTRRR